MREIRLRRREPDDGQRVGMRVQRVRVERAAACRQLDRVRARHENRLILRIARRRVRRLDYPERERPGEMDRAGDRRGNRPRWSGQDSDTRGADRVYLLTFGNTGRT